MREEGRQRIARLEAKVEHLAARIDYLSDKGNLLAAQMKNELGDVRATIKFTYADLDRARKPEQH